MASDPPPRPQHPVEGRLRRVAFVHPVQVQVPESISPPLRAHSINLSEGGMFIYAEQPLPVRLRVRIFLEVHGCPLLLGEGEVRWARSPAFTSYPWCPGFGVRFASLPARSRALVRRLVLTAAKLARAAPAPVIQGSARNPP